MATIADLEEMRAALVAARSTGARRTTFRDGGAERTVEYKTDDEMAAAIAAIDRAISAASGFQARRFLPTFSDGFTE